MFDDQIEDQTATGFASALTSGIVSVPFPLLKWYTKLSLNDTELVLLLQLIAFQQIDRTDLPSMEQLQARTALKPDVLASTLHKLMKNGWIKLESGVDGQSGMHTDRYDLGPLWNRIGQAWAADNMMQQFKQNAADNPVPKVAASGFSTSAEKIVPIPQVNVTPGRTNQMPQSKTPPNRPAGAPIVLPPPRLGPSLGGINHSGVTKPAGMPDIFSVFEEEFARPITPMERETISQWLDKDKVGETLVMMALREAVFNNKLNFRYIDKILLDWRTNNLRTKEDVKRFQQNNKE